jgi:hypothetical protein
MAVMVEGEAMMGVLVVLVVMVVVVMGRITGNGGTETGRGTAAGAAACEEAGGAWSSWYQV